MSESDSGSPLPFTKRKYKMTSKSLLFLGTLALAGIASAKSYDHMIISGPAKAGSLEIAAGEYSLKVEGNIAILTNVDSGKKFIAVVKVEDVGKKFEATSVDCTNKNEADRITSIELGGSNTKLELGE
jgi:hypothetical protein